jgi:chitinase
VTLFALFTLTLARKEHTKSSVTTHHYVSVHHHASTLKKKISTSIKKSSSVSKRTSKIYGKQRLVTYIVDWEVPKNIKWDKLDHVAYAFAEPNANGELASYTESNLKSGM